MIRLLAVTLVQGDEDEDRIFQVKLDIDGRETSHYRVFSSDELEVEGSPRLRCLQGPSRKTYVELDPYVDERFWAHPIFEQITRAIMNVDKGGELAFPIVIWEGEPLEDDAP